MTRPERPTCVYIFKGDRRLWFSDRTWHPDAHKIGVSHAPKQRLNDCAGAISIVHTIQFRTRKAAHLAEVYFHDICSVFAIPYENEWFRLDAENIQTFRMIKDERMAFDFIEACVKDSGDVHSISAWQMKRRRIERYSDRAYEPEDVMSLLVALNIDTLKPNEALSMLRKLKLMAIDELQKAEK